MNPQTWALKPYVDFRKDYVLLQVKSEEWGVLSDKQDDQTSISLPLRPSLWQLRGATYPAATLQIRVIPEEHPHPLLVGRIAFSSFTVAMCYLLVMVGLLF